MKTRIALLLPALFTMSLFNTACAEALEVGADAPSLSARIQTGETVDLGEVFAEGITMVFFYPKADTPGCTAQACSMRDSFEELTASGIKVYGVSYDNAADQTHFIEKYSLPFDLIVDEDKHVSEAFGRSPWARQAYLIKDGKIIWVDTKASTKTQAADVKKALMDLGIMNFDSMDH